MNIPTPQEFTHHLDQMLSAMYEVFEHARESTLVPVEDGCRRYYEEEGKCWFQVASQFKRPGEFFQTFLDMIRIMYEPSPPGTLLLNSNPCFLFDQISATPFQLGYLSAISEPDESISELFERAIAPKMAEYGYSTSATFARFAFVSLGKERYKMAQIGEVLKYFSAGFSVSDVLGGIASEIKGEEFERNTQSYAGFSGDEALGKRIRVSLWLFLTETQSALH